MRSICSTEPSLAELSPPLATPTSGARQGHRTALASSPWGCAYHFERPDRVVPHAMAACPSDAAAAPGGAVHALHLHGDVQGLRSRGQAAAERHLLQIAIG